MKNKFVSEDDITNIKERPFIIGAGWGRTGTASLKTAFEILKIGPSYHMFENYNNDNSNFWIRALKDEKCDFEEVFSKYNSTTDYPASVFWEDILKQYPNSKVVLTKRDPELWYQSCCETIFQMDRTFCNYPSLRFLELFIPSIKRFRNMIVLMHARDFNYNYEKENVIKAFNNHIANVINKCPKENLLVFEVKEGWEPLCKFLNVPVPDVPFPKINDTDELKSRIKNYIVTRSAIIILVILVLAYVIKKYLF